MVKVKIELDTAGVRQLLRSEEIAAACRQAAQGVASRAGAGYRVYAPYYGENRVNVAVWTTTKEARKDNLSNNTLLKALGGGT